MIAQLVYLPSSVSFTSDAEVLRLRFLDAAGAALELLDAQGNPSGTTFVDVAVAGDGQPTLYSLPSPLPGVVTVEVMVVTTEDTGQWTAFGEVLIVGSMP